MEQFGRYTLLGRLGHGGMCEVFMARRQDAPQNSPPVVLKRLLSGMREIPKAVELFHNEADLTSMLRHPNIVQVLDKGMVDEQAYMVMELLDGPDLNDLQRAAMKQGMSLGVPLSIFCCVLALRGLDYAHNLKSATGLPLGLVHRDISPDNLFCTSSGTVKVADFGIAKLGGLEAFTDPQMGLKGKLVFMAPERLTGEPMDSRVDQFAMALVLYELCTGVRAYGSTQNVSTDILMNRVKAADIVRPRKVMPEMTKALDLAIMKALDVKPKNRFKSCSEFADALQQLVAKDHLGAGPEQLKALLMELFPRGFLARGAPVLMPEPI